MIGKDLAKTLNYNFVALHTPLITSLKGPREKMSSSTPDSNISVMDSDEQIKKKIQKAYCPAKQSTNNPILEIIKLIIFPKTNKFIWDRWIMGLCRDVTHYNVLMDERY